MKMLLDFRRSLLLVCFVLDISDGSDVVEDDPPGVTENVSGTTENEVTDSETTTLFDIESTTLNDESSAGLGFRFLDPFGPAVDDEEIEQSNVDIDIKDRKTSTNPDYVFFRKFKPSGSSSCVTPNNESGSCKPINQCKYLHGLLVYKIRQPGVPDLLRRSQCGDRNSAAHYVCCPITNSHYSHSREPGHHQSKQSSSGKSSFFSKPTLSRTPQCGIRSLTSVKVVGGEESELGAWPWMVALFCSDNKQTKFHCGGSLISDQWVLTASHCSTCANSALTLTHARLGDVSLEKSSDDQIRPVTIPIKQFIRHPKYKLGPIQNDIALIRLGWPVKFSSFVHPICLLSGEQYKSDEFYMKNRLPYIAGWGSTDYGNPLSTRLMEGNVPIVSPTQCEKNYKNLKTQAVIDKRVICAGDGARDSCTGDSGGPLMFINTNTKIVYQGGVVSFGVRCAEKNFPGVYTKVAAFVDWINNSTGLSF